MDSRASAFNGNEIKDMIETNLERLGANTCSQIATRIDHRMEELTAPTETVSQWSI